VNLLIGVVMKSSKFVGNLLGQPAETLCLVAVFTAISLASSARATTAEAPAPNDGPPPAPTATVPETAPAPRFSPGIHDIVKMVDAKVDMDVVKVYIRNSPVPYSPNAEEIIALKKRGVPDEILTALLQRGAEVRTQAVQAVQSMPPAQTPVAAPYTPPYDPYAYGGYDYGSPYYAGYPYDYAYPYNYWYSYGYPWWGFSPFFFIDGFGHRHFRDFDRDGRFRAFHGDRNFGRNFTATSRSPFGTFNGRSAGFSGTRPLSSPFSPARSGFARSGGFRPGTGFGGMRTGGFSGHMGGGFRSGGGFGGHGGGGHR
jgi:hypothetical protein